MFVKPLTRDNENKYAILNQRGRSHSNLISLQIN